MLCTKVFRMTPAVRAISGNEKHTVVMPKVPPKTIRMAGRLKNDSGVPPRAIAVDSRPKPTISPRIVARSMDFFCN